MSVVTFPKYPINGLDPDAEAERLHFRKNKPERPEGDMEFPPYRFMPFPCAMYRRKGGEDIESALVGVNDYDADGNLIEMLRAKNEQQRRQRLETGWVNHPDDVDKAQRAIERDIARAAAESAADDLHMGEKARLERDAVDAVSDEHVVDVAASRRQIKDKR